MVVAAMIWLSFTAMSVAYSGQTLGLSEDLVQLVAALPDSLAQLVVGLVQLAAVAAPLVVLMLVRRGRWRELVLAAGAAAATVVATVLTAPFRAPAVPSEVIAAGEQPSWVTGAAFPSGTYLAAAAAAATVLSPDLPRGWRRLIWSSVAVISFARVVTALETPVGLLTGIAAGVFMGSLVMVVARAPLRSPPVADIEAALIAAGEPVMTVTLTPTRHRHGPTYEATGADGRRRFIKLVGRDERDAKLLMRAWRALRVASPANRTAVGVSETINNEALHLLFAARAGASIPHPVAVASAPQYGAMLVMDFVEGQGLDTIDNPSDELLRGAFDQLSMLHKARITHGWPSLHHIWVGPDQTVSLIDLRWARFSATESHLAQDLAGMLIAVAAAHGVTRSVAAASAFSPQQLGVTLPLIQPLSLDPETRAAVRGTKDLLSELRTEIQRVAQVDTYEMAKLERLSFRKLIVFVATLLLATVLLTLLGNINEIWAAIKGANPAYLPFLLVIPLLGYPAGAVSLMGAVPRPIAFLPTTEVMFAQAFLNRFTPANAGGMALRTRYLQRNGIPLVNSASSVAITSAASGVVQVVLALVFFTWVGSSNSAINVSFPAGMLLAVVALVLLTVVGVVYATAKGRKLLRYLRVNLASAFRDLRTLAHQPSKLLLLFTGALAGKLASIITFALTIEAFGTSLSFAAVGAMYITATTIASAAPTPGGVGAIEAALIAGLVGLGVEAGEAAAIVLVFRLFSYWLPILPCWLFLARVQRSDLV
ncbi:MAG: flippase-like domain-containing protein [Acidimicrobiia bacterium]|nr:flippase-like domain-containing protein [Acidimicrobiia bacterium]